MAAAIPPVQSVDGSLAEETWKFLKQGKPSKLGSMLWASLQAAAQWAEASLGLFLRRKKKALKLGVTIVYREIRTSLHVASARISLKQRVFKLPVNPSAASPVGLSAGLCSD